MFTRPLNVKCYRVHRFWIMLTSVLEYILFAPVDHNFSCDGLLYISLCHFHSLVFKWLNLNHSPSLCDCRSLSLPITVKQVSLLLITGCIRTGLGYPDSKIPRAPWMTHVCASHRPHVGCHWSMHTGVCNNFPRGTHGFCLSKDPHGTQMKPMCICHLYGPCWATMWLPLWGHTRAATKGADWSMQQLSMWGPCVLPLKSTHMGPT